MLKEKNCSSNSMAADQTDIESDADARLRIQEIIDELKCKPSVYTYCYIVNLTLSVSSG